MLIIAYWKIFMISTLQSLQNNPNICVILVLASVFCFVLFWFFLHLLFFFFFILFEIILGFGMNDFLLKPVYFGWYKTPDLIYFLNVCLLLRERVHMYEREWGRGRERGRQRIPSRLHAVTADPDMRLKPTNQEIVT